MVGQATGLHEQRIGSLVSFCDSNYFGSWVHGGYGVCSGESCSRLGENASSAANVEVFALVVWWQWWYSAQAAVDEGMPVLVHKVEQSA